MLQLGCFWLDKRNLGMMPEGGLNLFFRVNWQAGCQCDAGFVHFGGVGQHLNPSNPRLIEQPCIIRIHIGSDLEADAVGAVDHIEHDRAVALFDHLDQFAQMLGTAFGDAVGKLGQIAGALKCDGFDLDVTIRQAVACQQKVDAAVLTVFHLGADIRIHRKFRNSAQRQRLGHQRVWHVGINAGPVIIGQFAQLPTVTQLAFWIVVPLNPNPHPPVLQPRHRAGIAAMGRHLTPIGQDHIGQKAFIAADQRGADKGGLKLHGVALYLARPSDKIGASMANPTAAFLVIGDEILSGRTRDKNIGFLADQLCAAAIDLKEVRVVDDDHHNILRAVRELSARWDHVFSSGGIGPTHDDITADAMAAAFEVAIDVRDDARALLEAYTGRNGGELNDARLRMARIPDGALLIDNPVSVAPGFTIENVHVMAGVPAVFQAMVSSVLPGLTGGVPLLSRTLRIDRPEGEIAGPLGEVAARHAKVSIGSYPFILQGRFGANIVFRCSDRTLLEAAVFDLSALFPEAREL